MKKTEFCENPNSTRVDTSGYNDSIDSNLWRVE